MIIDEAEIEVAAGKGGNGCLSFRRERFIPKGGPDGGDGGDGGNVYVEADSSVETLLDFSYRRHWKAGNGRPGMGKNKAGANGADVVLQLPVGTLIYDRDADVLLKDLTTPGLRVCVAEGGKGGRGNARFASPTHQTPREFERGGSGRERRLRLELKLIADVGLVGLPNAGKSTLLSRLSRARPKIADYPFTTLQPLLGIVELPGHRRFVMADIPGLIAGAHQGAGLGDEFLRHIERTQIIVHLVDVGTQDVTMTPARAYRTIRRELEQYSPSLASKKEIVVGSKTDVGGVDDGIRELAVEVAGRVWSVSAVTGEGLSDLTEHCWHQLSRSADRQNDRASPR